MKRCVYAAVTVHTHTHAHTHNYTHSHTHTHCQVLLVSSNKSTNIWTIPGGGYEPGESFEETALREAKEEVSMEVQINAQFSY